MQKSAPQPERISGTAGGKKMARMTRITGRAQARRRWRVGRVNHGSDGALLARGRTGRDGVVALTRMVVVTAGHGGGGGGEAARRRELRG